MNVHNAVDSLIKAAKELYLIYCLDNRLKNLLIETLRVILDLEFLELQFQLILFEQSEENS